MIVAEKLKEGYGTALNVTFKYKDEEFTVTDWNKTYDENSRFNYYGSKQQYTPKPGLFMYSGFGTGDYYSITGRIFSCSTTESSMLAALEGVERVYKDSFDYYRSTYVGD